MPKYMRVAPSGDQWSVELDGVEQGVYDTQAEAEAKARQLAVETGAEFEPLEGSGEDPTDVSG